MAVPADRCEIHAAVGVHQLKVVLKSSQSLKSGAAQTDGTLVWTPDVILHLHESQWPECPAVVPFTHVDPVVWYGWSRRTFSWD